MLSGYRKLWAYLFQLILSHKRLLMTTVLLFVFGIAVTLSLPASFKTDLALLFIDKIAPSQVSQSATLRFIILNNLRVSLLSILTGLLIFPPYFILLLNGITVGAVFFFGSFTSPTTTLALTLPHGVIELPAILISNFLGILLSVKLLFKHKVQPHVSRRRFLLSLIKIYAVILAPLIIVASIIETFVTVPLAGILRDKTINKSDPATSALLINEADLKSLGLSGTKVENIHQIPCQWAQFRETLIADAGQNQRVKDQLKKPHAGVMFSLGNGSYAAVQMMKDDTVTPEQVADGLYRRMLKLHELDNDIRTTPIAGSYMTNYQGTNCFFRYNVTNGYNSAILYQGDDFNRFQDISDHQLTKIKQ